jgi:transcriptional regulator with XRE-family HTH domain
MPDSIKKIVAWNIQRLRQEARWTQAELAERLDLDQSTIGRWESGNRWPEAENIEALARVFRVPEGFFFLLDGAPSYGPIRPLAEAIRTNAKKSLEELWTGPAELRDAMIRVLEFGIDKGIDASFRMLESRNIAGPTAQPDPLAARVARILADPDLGETARMALDAVLTGLEDLPPETQKGPPEKGK